MNYPKTFQKLIECFECLPGVGPKTAERYAFYAIKNSKRDDVVELIKALSDSMNLICECSRCGMLSESELCDICEDDSRTKQLMIIEDCKSLVAYEKTKVYQGRYHILKSLISPINGVGPEDIGLDKIFQRIKDEGIEEIIIATSPSMEGELTALYIKKMISKLDNVKVYQIGYGLPADGSIEYADEITLIKSLEGKKEL